jgi:hypothetical protein
MHNIVLKYLLYLMYRFVYPVSSLLVYLNVVCRLYFTWLSVDPHLCAAISNLRINEGGNSKQNVYNGKRILELERLNHKNR